MICAPPNLKRGCICIKVRVCLHKSPQKHSVFVDFLCCFDINLKSSIWRDHAMERKYSKKRIRKRVRIALILNFTVLPNIPPHHPLMPLRFLSYPKRPIGCEKCRRSRKRILQGPFCSSRRGKCIWVFENNIAQLSPLLFLFFFRLGILFVPFLVGFGKMAQIIKAAGQGDLGEWDAATFHQHRRFFQAEIQYGALGRNA